MEKLQLSLDNLNEAFPDDFTQEQVAMAKTLFLKKLAESAHKFYGGKFRRSQRRPFRALTGLMSGIHPVSR